MTRRYTDALQQTMDGLDPEEHFVEPEPPEPPPGAAAKAETAVPLERLRELNASLLALPADFTMHRKLERVREKRHTMFDAPDERTVDWAAAEELALGVDPRRRPASGSPARMSSAAPSAIATRC
jgi:2-oxoglutarate dehydrogenase E1 component